MFNFHYHLAYFLCFITVWALVQLVLIELQKLKEVMQKDRRLEYSYRISLSLFHKPQVPKVLLYLMKFIVHGIYEFLNLYDIDYIYECIIELNFSFE